MCRSFRVVAILLVVVGMAWSLPLLFASPAATQSPYESALSSPDSVPSLTPVSCNNTHCYIIKPTGEHYCTSQILQNCVLSKGGHACTQTAC